MKKYKIGIKATERSIPVAGIKIIRNITKLPLSEIQNRSKSNDYIYECDALDDYGLTSCASKKYQSKNKMFDTSQRLQRIKQFVDKQRKIISQHFVDQSGTKSTKSFGENSFGLKLL